MIILLFQWNSLTGNKLYVPNSFQLLSLEKNIMRSLHYGKITMMAAITDTSSC